MSAEDFHTAVAAEYPRAHVGLAADLLRANGYVLGQAHDTDVTVETVTPLHYYDHRTGTTFIL